MTATVRPNGVNTFLDFNGNPLAGGLVYTYATGTTTPLPTFADAAELAQNPNPIVLDSAGRATIFWDGIYKVVVRSADGSLTETIDPLADSASQLKADLDSAAAGKGSNLVVDVAPTTTADVAPAQGLSFAINSVVDIARMANNFGSGGNDTVAMQKAVRYAAQNGGKMYLRGGTTARIGAVDLSGVREFWGDGPGASLIVPSGTLAAAAQLITLMNPTSVGLRDFTIDLMDSSVNATQLPIQLVSPTDVTIENVVIPHAGACAIRSSGATRLTLSRIKVGAYVDLGLLAQSSGNRVVFDRCSVVGTGNYHAMQIIGGGLHEIRDSYTEGAKIFGASAFDCDGIKITGNTFKDGYVEACNVQDTLRFTISNNDCYQRSSGATDFGMSVFGDPNTTNPTKYGLIEGNRIFGAFKSGIALAANVTYVHVCGNHIMSPNAANEAQGAGVLLYGGGCQLNSVYANHISDEGGKMRWGVNEFNDGTGNPSNNRLGPNRVYNGSQGENNFVGLNSEAFDQEWVAQGNATLTASTGTINASVVNKSLFKRHGKTIFVAYDVTITDAGSGAGDLLIQLPITANTNGGVISGREIVNTGHSIDGLCNGSAVRVRDYLNATPIASGARLVLSGTYEAL